MDKMKKYDRVMPRVFSQSKSSIASSSNVQKHDYPSTVRVGAKPPASNFGSSVYCDLPTVLNDYIPETVSETHVRRTLVVKPRRTLKSMNPPVSATKNVGKPREPKKARNIRTMRPKSSVPLLGRQSKPLSETYRSQCYSSLSSSRLNDLRNEIKSYQDTEKLMKLQSHLYKKCGVVFDDVSPEECETAVQTVKVSSDSVQSDKRSEQWSCDRENARASVFDEQMRSGPTRYPVDRYLDQSSKQFELVSIIGEEIWNPEPALRPEDEIILRKLHDMLQSTADDLKLLSGELSKFHEPGVQVTSQPTPLDEEFNEKVHIEEVVNAKFHGYKIIQPDNLTIDRRKPNKNLHQNNKLVNKIAGENKVNNDKKTTIKKLGLTRTRIMQITNDDQGSIKSQKLNNGKVMNTPAVGYNEFCYTYVEPEVQQSPRKVLQVQDMPSINIRGELRKQEVFKLDILPETKNIVPNLALKSNVSVVSVSHGPKLNDTEKKEKMHKSVPKPIEVVPSNTVTRKISKMSTCESSGSTNNVSSDAKLNLLTQQRILTSIRNSPKSSARSRNKKNNKNEPERSRSNLDEWKRKLNLVYGASTSKKSSYKQLKKPHKTSEKQKIPKSTEYIPYSKLTIGGVRPSDIEREISDLPHKKDLPLNPIINEILSRENSFRKKTIKKEKRAKSPKILSTSDENLLQEVLDIEKSVTETLSKQLKSNKEVEEDIDNHNSKKSDGNESYDDDFEDEKSNHSIQLDKSEQLTSIVNLNDPKDSDHSDDDENKTDSSQNLIVNDNSFESENENKNTTFTKQSNLSFKESVDVFEFIHAVDTQDTATQSNGSNKITPKETQTSPNHNATNIQPIHNDLWPIDPRREVEKMFELEKEFIKKLIIDEYGDLLEKNINKPSTSNEMTVDSRMNATTLQKNTQTSPAHVKSVMTSPKRTKTRTTSPHTLSVPIHQQTSPIVFLSNEHNEVQKLEISNEADDISINLSSPRFSLRLPQNSKEVLSNLGANSHHSSKVTGKRDSIKRSLLRKTLNSSTSVDADNSSSELSSLGEIKIKRKLRRRVPTSSESSSKSTLSKHSIDLQSIGIIPLKSEGEELSLGQISKKTSRRHRPSDGETSFGQK